MTRFALTLLIAFAASYHACAQGRDYSGEWYISFNEAHRHYKGYNARINLEQKGGVYTLTTYRPDSSEAYYYAPDYPAEGDYIPDKYSNLVKDGFKISGVKNRLVYEKDGIVVLLPLKMAHELDKYFYSAGRRIDTANVLTDEKLKKVMLRESLKDINKFLAFDNQCIECYMNQGIALLSLGKTDSALGALSKIIALDTDYSGIPELKKSIADRYMRDAWNLYGKAGKYKDAIKCLQKSLALDSVSADAWYNLGGAYYSDKQYAKAIPAFKKALELDPAREDAQRGLDGAKQMLEMKK